LGLNRIQIARDATEHLTPCNLELGGKDPAILLPATDLSKWSSVLMRGIFQNAGQNCIGIERVLVHADQYDELHTMLAERASRLRVGAVMAQSPEGHLPTVDVGAMINGANFERLRTIVDDAVAGHATVDVGGGPYTHPYHEHGTYFTPTVIGDPHQDTKITKEEGQCASLMHAPQRLTRPQQCSRPSLR
jgi:acyl-CoA reductase-like NAD-dependent aldehyde dehydrogenase